MATARDFITLALKEAGVLGIGQTANAEDINDCFTLLHRMLAQWQKKRWIVPNLIDVYAPGNSQRSNLIGPGQHYNSARPDKIQSAYFKQLNSGSSNNVSYPLAPIWSYEDYSRIALKDLNSWPTYYFYDAAFPYGNVFIWPIPTSAYEVHLIVKGPIGFTVEVESGEILTAGTGYANGAYVGVPLTNTNGFGGGATADITVAGGIVTQVAINDKGDGYKINDTLSASNAYLGGTGTGFVWKVTNVTDSLDAEFNMPPEYEEAIHYNLCVRIVSMYQLPANPVAGKLAVLALNTIRNSNSQISQLQMPAALRNNNGGAGFYIFNADAR
jgi:hypothetical protein